MIRLVRDVRGVAMLEFAFALPLLLTVILCGLEMAYFALANLRVSQIALALADNASRVGVASGAVQQLREIDLLDALAATRKHGEKMRLTTYGRVTLSSLEADENDVQRIHWQRCLGLKSGSSFDSHYGTAPVDAGTQAGTGYAGTVVSGGMGATGAKVVAPTSSGVMFVEVNYLYQPLFGRLVLGTPRIHYVASFIVRDRRDFTQVYNPTPAVAESDKLTCNRYTN